MTLAFEHLAGTDSPLGRLDPRWRLAALALAALAVAGLRSLPAATAALAGAALLAGLARLPGRWVAKRLAVAGLALVPFALWLALARPDQGVGAAGRLVLKGLALVTLVLVGLASAPPHVTLAAAQALRVPGLLVQLVLLTYRYVFVLADELARLRVALRVRGYRNRMTAHSYRTVGHVAGTLLVRGAERAERVGQAMRCRGFDGRFRCLADFRTTAADVAAFAALTAAAAGLLLFDLWLTSTPAR